VQYDAYMIGYLPAEIE